MIRDDSDTHINKIIEDVRLYETFEEFDSFDECQHADKFLHHGVLKCKNCPAVFDENILEWVVI